MVRDPYCQSSFSLSRSDTEPVLSNQMTDRAATAGRGTVPFYNNTAASIDVHVTACVAVAHRRMRDAIVTDLVVHSDKTILLQTALFASAVHKNVIKAKLPKYTRNDNTARTDESFSRRERRLEQTMQGILLLSEGLLNETFALNSGFLFSDQATFTSRPQISVSVGDRLEKDSRKTSVMSEIR